MKLPVFTIGMLGGACRPGADEAASLFERGKEYTLAEVIEAGASLKNVLWLLKKRAGEDEVTWAFLRAWAASCGCQKAAKLKTPDECLMAVKDGIRERKRAEGIRKGSWSWAYDRLYELAGVKGKQDGAGKMAADDR